MKNLSRLEPADLRETSQEKSHFMATLHTAADSLLLKLIKTFSTKIAGMRIS